MASKLGPRIVTDNLVLALDCADAKSYAGEPITNMAYNLGIGGQGSTWEAISEVPSSIGQTGPGANVDFKKLHDDSIANTFSGANGKIFRNYVNNPGASNYNNGGFRYPSAIALTSGGDSGYVIISFWCYLVTGYNTGLGNSYMRFQNSGGYTGNGNRTFYVDGVSKSASETFNADTGRWKFVQIRFSKPTGSTAIQNFYIYADFNTQGEMYICQLQIEDRSDSTFYQVPFVEGASSRSATDGWVDLSGNSNDGTLVNDVATGTSHYRSGDVILPNSARYLDFDGTDQYIDLGTISSGDNLYISQGSIELWFKYSTSQNGVILGWGGGSHWGNLAVANNWTGSVSNESIVIGSYKSSTDYYAFYVTDGADYYGDGNWHHIVFTKGVNNSTNIACYIDGVQKTMLVAKAGTGEFFLDNIASSQINVGRRVYSADNAYYNGQVASIKIYSDILTQAEALQNYNSTKSRFS